VPIINIADQRIVLSEGLERRKVVDEAERIDRARYWVRGALYCCTEDTERHRP